MKKNIKSFEILMLVLAIMCLPAASRAQTATEIAEIVMHSDE